MFDVDRFDEALGHLRPRGDDKVPGLRAGMIAAAPTVFTKFGLNSSLVVCHAMGSSPRSATPASSCRRI